MLTFKHDDLTSCAQRILDMHPDPAPRFRLLRDVLDMDEANPIYQEAKANLGESKWIRLLESSQHSDGTWGRYHTQDTTVKQPFLTTEHAIRDALALGLEADHPVIQRVMPPLLDYVEGRSAWPDPPEVHDNPLAWYVWNKHYAAAYLSLIDPYHPLLESFWQIWADVVAEAFESGIYDHPREIAALNRLLECRMKNPVPFHTMYPLLILSATHNRLPVDLERRTLEFLLHYPQGIYYIYDRQIDAFPAITERRFWSWVRAQAILARFPLWKEFAVGAADWIWAQRGVHGLWDFGSRISRRPISIFPLSESWRKLEQRIIDSSVEVLVLLRKLS